MAPPGDDGDDDTSATFVAETGPRADDAENQAVADTAPPSGDGGDGDGDDDAAAAGEEEEAAANAS